jgi:hypothetical protein
MKRFWLSGFCVCAGWFAGAAAGQETSWPPPSPRPLAIARTEGTPLTRPAGVSIGRPQPLEAPRDADAGPHEPAVIPTAFRASADGPRPVLRAKLLDDAPAADAPALRGAPELPPAPVPVERGPTANAEIIKMTPAPRPGTGPATPGKEAGKDGKAAGKEPAPDATPAPRPVGPWEAGTPFATDAPVFLPADDGGHCAESHCAETGVGWRDAVSPGARFYASAEYLLWWVKGFNTPPLVTTSPASVPQPLQGVLGVPTTTVLFGGSPLSQDVFSGGRFRAGYAFGPCNLWAVEGSYFFLSQQSVRFNAASPATPVIARPFLANDSVLGQFESAQLVASPGTNPGDLFSSTGSIRINAPTEFWGAELNARRTICCGCNYKFDLLAGYRFLSLREGLHITEDLLALRAVPSAGTGVGDHIVVTDRFDTRNRFHGGQLGAAGEWRYGRLVLGGSVKVALGNVHQVIDINGLTTITPGDPTLPVRQTPAGLLALSSNSGTFTRDRFAVVPEVGLQVGYQVTDYLRAFVGYNFIYLSNVVRPGDQIDRVLNTNLIPPGTPNAPAGVAHPVVPFKTTDFWAQGISFGLEFRY